jgi:DHA1 family inner membrane transport protein
MSPPPPPPVPRRILPAIAVSQFAGTSLWFAINAVVADLQRQAGLPETAAGWLTAAVQLGFIAGTFAFALLAIADRYSPRKVFLACTLAGAALALLTAALPPQLGTLLVLRFATGVCLAGIYPVGMKIAAGWYGSAAAPAGTRAGPVAGPAAAGAIARASTTSQGLGWALGVLVGALILGTALPFGLRAIGAHWPWQTVMWSVAAIAAAGGLLMAWAVPDGPHLAPAARIAPGALRVIWRDPAVRASAFGYFGHMWELYAFYVLLPAIVATRYHADPALAAGWVFAAIAVGLVSCVAGGAFARHVGGARVAAAQLACSGLCGLVAPWLLDAPLAVWAAWLLLWGATVSGDSPQFSALTAANAPRATVGSVLTFVNAIGFSISVATIALFAALAAAWPLAWVLPGLALGPAIGLWFLGPLLGFKRLRTA